MTSEKDIIRYLRVRALAEKGVEGERRTAARIVTDLEKKFPGIRFEAASYEKQQAARGTKQTAPPPPGVHPKGPVYTAPEAAEGNWENIFSWAQGVAQNVYGFAQTVGNVLAGRQLAEMHVRSGVRVSKTDRVLITLSMSMNTYEQAARLNRMQHQAFREAVHAKLAKELDSIFVDEDEEQQD